METVIVKFTDSGGGEVECDVLIDSQQSGKTGQKLMVQTGHHEFALDTDISHQPDNVERLVQNTSSDDPDIIDFTAS